VLLEVDDELLELDALSSLLVLDALSEEELLSEDLVSDFVSEDFVSDAAVLAEVELLAPERLSFL
jgi:hypothetical protein